MPLPRQTSTMAEAASSGLARLRLKKREERRLEAGHLWVFSNEVDTSLTPIKSIEPGAAAIIESASGKFLAHAYVNPTSLICARITSRNKSLPFSSTVLRERLTQALALRERMFDEPYYRMVHSEGDFLPGLTVDRYGDVIVAQITTAGMERFKDELVDALVSMTGASSLCFKNDTAVRNLEGLLSYVEWAHGTAPNELTIRENNLDFVVPTELSQKTGWFYDHRSSRLALQRWVAGKRVLDLYSYIGGFGLNAVAAGAEKVLSVDVSESATFAANNNAKRNNLQAAFHCETADAVEKMRELFSAGEHFDVVVLDPPAFIKRKKDRDAGLRHYALNNRLALKLLKPGGLVLSASCSQSLSQHDLQQAMRSGVPKGSQGLQVLESFQQAADHPVNIAMSESLYLKGVIARLL